MRKYLLILFLASTVSAQARVVRAALEITNELKGMEKEFKAAEAVKMPINDARLVKLNQRAITLLEEAVSFGVKDPDVILLETIMRVDVFVAELEPTGYAGGVVLPLFEAHPRESKLALGRIDQLRTKRLRQQLRVKMRERKRGGNG